jgi:hypoxanthine phosphoribosyltransferase
VRVAAKRRTQIARAAATRPLGDREEAVAPAASTSTAVHPLAAPHPAEGGNAIPPRWRADLADVLITEAQLARRIQELARALTHDYVGRDLTVVALLTGTVVFLADLLRRLAMPLRLDFMGVSSYREGTTSRELVFTKELRLELRGRDVLLVDDILDTGRTLGAVRTKLAALGPRSVRTCVLLDKPGRRVEAIEAEYVGFTVPDLFVVGYGLDYAERYRNLPFVGVLRPALYQA